MSEELETKKRHLSSLKAFMASPAYGGYHEALEREIEITKEAILNMIPDSVVNFVEECQLRGELRLLEAERTRFEEACVSLEARIDEIAEAELENATNRTQ